jgi:hypothetical protein
MEYVLRTRGDELDQLETKLRTKQIDLEEYTLQREAIMRKYRVR